MTGPAPTDVLARLLGRPVDRGPARVLGLFAHPDDEVFCAGGVLSLASASGAATAIVSLTRGEAGQIQDSAVATRRTLGAVRAAELEASAAALGVGDVEVQDLGDGRLATTPYGDLVARVAEVLARRRPDVVLTFDDDGGFGHPDHILSSRAVLSAVDALPPGPGPRVLQARFPRQDRLLLDLLVQWLVAQPARFTGRAGFGQALRLLADGSTVLGFAADHLHVQWFPAGSFVIEQGEPSRELYCLLSGTVDIVVEDADGGLRTVDTAGPGHFLGQDGLATGRPRNAHVVAREDVTCFVLAPGGRDLTAGRGSGAVVPGDAAPGGPPDDVPGADLVLDVRAALDRKVAALVAHRSQYALEPDLLPRTVLEPLLGTESFTVARE